jgi:hypothetical protein
MKAINVFIYGYKTEKLLENVVSFIGQESGTNQIMYHVFDQSNTDKSIMFNKIENVLYRHVPWDDTRGIPYYRKHILFDQTAKYFLELSPNISLSKNWDLLLIDSLLSNTIISGNSFKRIEVRGGSISFDEEKVEGISESNFIDTNLIFLKQADSIFLNQLQHLKKYGQNLFGSIVSMNRGVRILSMSSDFYTVKSDESDILYYPYSKTHGYNRMIDIVSSLNNDEFEKFHGIKVSEIPKLAYQVDDVPYHNARTSIDQNVSTKFHSGYNRIQVV